MDQTVFVVDDDPEIGSALGWLLESIETHVETYTSAEAFLEAYSGRQGCLVLDVRMKGIGGLRLQEILKERGDHLPIIFITGHGDIPMAVRAMKNGSVEFLTKPFNNQVLLEAIQRALEYNASQQREQTKYSAVRHRLQTLTSRELEVLKAIVNGKLSKTIAFDFGISLHTVEGHRAKIMRKMRAKTLAELISMVLKADLGLAEVA
ncbi:MAG: DNA-binding response regulator [marine bacterium B5-7]|nr:MAG: DNA-binding response regulator [marine bacterium B5-7]